MLFSIEKWAMLNMVNIDTTYQPALALIHTYNKATNISSSVVFSHFHTL